VNGKNHFFDFIHCMKAELYNSIRLVAKCMRKYFGIATALFLLTAKKQAQSFIPVDSGFAERIRVNNPALAGCISNYQLDTTCAKGANFDTIYLRPNASSPITYTAKSFEGLQYFGLNYLGQPQSYSLK
jgi:hypothetical protein